MRVGNVRRFFLVALAGGVASMGSIAAAQGPFVEAEMFDLDALGLLPGMTSVRRDAPLFVSNEGVVFGSTTATATDALGNTIDAFATWRANGQSITRIGVFPQFPIDPLTNSGGGSIADINAGGAIVGSTTSFETNSRAVGFLVNAAGQQTIIGPGAAAFENQTLTTASDVPQIVLDNGRIIGTTGARVLNTNTYFRAWTIAPDGQTTILGPTNPTYRSTTANTFFSQAWGSNQAGLIIGSSQNFYLGNGRGEDAWLFDAATNAYTTLGLFGPQFQGVFFERNRPTFINETGIVAGITLAPGLGDSGNLAAWVAQNGNTTRVGLTASPFADSQGLTSVRLVALDNDQSIVAGTSDKLGVSTIASGAWVARDGVTTRIGLSDALHLGANDGFEQNQAAAITDDGVVIGFANRIDTGGSFLNASTWIYDTRSGSPTTVRIGLQDPIHTSAGGAQYAVPIGFNDRGQIVGQSARFATGTNTSNGTSTWIYDVNAGTTTTLAFAVAPNGRSQTRPLYITTFGGVVGVYQKFDGNTSLGFRAFYWSPRAGFVDVMPDRRLTPDQAQNFPIAVSPDGTRVAIGDGLLTGDPSLLLISLDDTTCDSIDFNNDGAQFDPADIDAFFSVFSEGPCVPSTADCNDVDFNNDGSIFDPCDFDSFLTAFGEGACTLCGQ
jgi:hypothetical protein